MSVLPEHDLKLKQISITVKRTTFDDNLDVEFAKDLQQKLPLGDAFLGVRIKCDVCELLVESNKRPDIIRRLCDKCNFYYDFCVTHPQPTKCPLCYKECN